MHDRSTKKRALVMGLADARSIAGGIIRAMVDEGWEVVATAHSHPTAFKMAQRGLKRLGLEGKVELWPCDVAGGEALPAVADQLAKHWPEGFDYLIHAIAFSDKKELQGSILDTTPANFQLTMEVSARSLLAVCKAFSPLMRQDGCVMCLTFAGSQYNAPNYNVMGMAKAALESATRYLATDPLLTVKRIRTLAMSPGPVLTMSASAIGAFDLSLKMGELRSAYGANVTLEELGTTALHLLQCRGMTGVVIPVDNGIHLAGMGSTAAEMAMVAELIAKANATEDGTPD